MEKLFEILLYIMLNKRLLQKNKVVNSYFVL